MSKDERGEKSELAALLTLAAAVVILAVIVVFLLRGLPEIGEDWNPIEDAANAISRLFERPEQQMLQPGGASPADIQRVPVSGGDADHVILELERVSGSLVVRDGWIYYSYADFGEVIVRRIAPDGTDQEVFRVAWDWQWPLSRGFEITEAGNALFFFEYWDAESESLIYAKYNTATGTRTYYDLTEAIAPEAQWRVTTEVIFDEEENLALNVVTEDGNIIHIFGSDGVLRGVLKSEEERISIARMRDGRIISMIEHMDAAFRGSWILQEIDMTTGQWGETISVLQQDTQMVTIQLYSAPPNAAFDLYLEALWPYLHLYGYDMESGRLTRLFSREDIWEDALTAGTWIGGFLEDGRIVVGRFPNLDDWPEDGVWQELHILRP